jgi:hypothetical protein
MRVQVQATKDCCKKQNCIPLRFHPKRDMRQMLQTLYMTHHLGTMIQNISSNARSCESGNKEPNGSGEHHKFSSKVVDGKTLMKAHCTEFLVQLWQ